MEGMSMEIFLPENTGDHLAMVGFEEYQRGI
jgi:hypothetical protein